MKILYFDDYHFLHATIKKVCQNFSYVVDIVSTVKQAENCLRFNQYDVVILDLNADFGAAEKFLFQLRKDNVQIPIVVATAKTDRNLKLRLLENLVDDYLIKPFEWEELMVRVKAIYRRLEILPYEDNWLDYGIVKLNDKKHQVIVNGEKLNLRHKEFLILKYFLEHIGDVVSREELLEKVWDQNVDLFSNSINVHLYNLRKKIKAKLPDHQLIKTVPRKGFKLLLPQFVG